MKLEIACFSYSDALLAKEAGADRVELCKRKKVGGLTPAIRTSVEACRSLKIPVFIMVRPMAQHFCYTEEHIVQMKKTIRFFKKNKCAGFVFGILDKSNRVNKERCKELVKLAAPLPCTFHRAFDETPDLYEALEDVIECGFKRILTSGGRGDAHRNIETLAVLVKKAGKKIIIMPGGGVRKINILNTVKRTKCKEIHSGAIAENTKRISAGEIKAMKSLIK